MGYSQMAALRDAFESLGAEVILADAGDYSQGTPMSAPRRAPTPPR